MLNHLEEIYDATAILILAYWKGAWRTAHPTAPLQLLQHDRLDVEKRWATHTKEPEIFLRKENYTNEQFSKMITSTLKCRGAENDTNL